MPLSQTDQIYYENEENWGNYQFVNLEDLVNNFLQNYTGDSTLLGQINRSRVIYQVKQCVREFHYGMLNQVKVAELSLGDTLDVILPPSYVDYVRISWLDQTTGQIRPMSVNRNTPLSVSYLQDSLAYILFDNNGDTLVGTSISEHINNNLPPVIDVNNYPNGCNYYGIDPQWQLDTSRNFNGTFNSDNTRIHFGSESSERLIVLEYISDGLEALEADIKIHKFAEDACYAYVHKRLAESSIRVPDYEKRRLKKEYDTLVRNAKVRLLNIKPQEFLQAWKVQNTPIR